MDNATGSTLHGNPVIMFKLLYLKTNSSPIMEIRSGQRVWKHIGEIHHAGPGGKTPWLGWSEPLTMWGSGGGGGGKSGPPYHELACMCVLHTTVNFRRLTVVCLVQRLWAPIQLTHTHTWQEIWVVPALLVASVSPRPNHSGTRWERAIKPQALSLCSFFFFSFFNIFF